MTWERGSCTNWEHNLSWIRITTFKQATVYTCPRPSVSSILFTYQLLTTHMCPYIFCIINYRPLVRFQAVSVHASCTNLLSKAPGNPQEQSQLNTVMSCANITCHTVSDKYLNSYVHWMTTAIKQLTANRDTADSAGWTFSMARLMGSRVLLCLGVPAWPLEPFCCVWWTVAPVKVGLSQIWSGRTRPTDQIRSQHKAIVQFAQCCNWK